MLFLSGWVCGISSLFNLSSSSPVSSNRWHCYQFFWMMTGCSVDTTSFLCPRTTCLGMEKLLFIEKSKCYCQLNEIMTSNLENDYGSLNHMLSAFQRGHPGASKENISTDFHFCSHCKKKFSNNSRPIKCYKCSKFIHKTKCIGVCPSLPTQKLIHCLQSQPSVSVLHSTSIPTFSSLSRSINTPALTRTTAQSASLQHSSPLEIQTEPVLATPQASPRYTPPCASAPTLSSETKGVTSPVKKRIRPTSPPYNNQSEEASQPSVSLFPGSSVTLSTILSLAHLYNSYKLRLWWALQI